MARKHQVDWNNHRVQIISVLTGAYKVKMLEGPKKGDTHKYVFGKLRRPEEEDGGSAGAAPPAIVQPPAAIQPPAEALGASATAEDEPMAEEDNPIMMQMQDLADLFGS